MPLLSPALKPSVYTRMQAERAYDEWRTIGAHYLQTKCVHLDLKATLAGSHLLGYIRHHTLRGLSGYRGENRKGKNPGAQDGPPTSPSGSRTPAPIGILM